MNFEWLFSFARFGESRNFTHAAAALHISQPALHVQIKKLSESVGVPLYRRVGRGLVLTPEGQRLAAFARRVQDEQTDVLAEVRGETLRGPVVLTAGPGAFMYLLGPAVKQFPKGRWPLRLLNQSGPEALASVRDARAHLAVAVVSEPPPDLESVRLRSVGQMAVMKTNHRLAKRRTLRARDLDGEGLVVAPSGRPHRRMLEQAMRTENVALSVSVEAMGWEVMLDFVTRDMGIAVVNDFCKVPRGCSAVAMSGLPKVSYYLVARKATNPGIRRLRELIISTAS